MYFGGAMFFTDYSISAVELALALEERGFESVWAPEHSHIPLSRKTPFPGGGDLPKPYYDAMDPFVVLAAAGQATKTIKLGTGVVLVQQRDAIQTAKLVASLDQMSQGRFLFGIGGGWNQDEMEDHGTVYSTRFKRVRESIEAMKEIWTKEAAEYHGEFVNFDPMIARPKPVQKPHPPIHVGGAFPHGARRAIRYGDGWIPTARGDVAEVLPKFREMAREAGRDPASIEITSFGLSEDLDRVKRLAETGSRPRCGVVSAREGGHGAADGRPLDEHHAAGQRVVLDRDRSADAVIVSQDMTRSLAEGRRAEATALPGWVKPQLTRLVDQPPDGPEWLHEIKYDGYRMHARLDRGAVRLLTRTGLDWTHKYPAIASALTSLPARQAYLDGELCGIRPDGTTSFSLIQTASDAGNAKALVFFLFDLLHLDGEAIGAKPLDERKERLRALLSQCVRRCNTATIRSGAAGLSTSMPAP